MVLVFAELVTNVLAHAGPASTTVVTHEPPSVRIEVHDTSHVMPHVRNDTQAGGFGLLIVSRLSRDWGWRPTPTGKIVWAVIPCGH